MAEVDWDERARQGVGLQSVIDPGDRNGLKNGLIDRIQWGVVQPWARSRREVLDYGCGIGRFAKRITAAGTAYCGVDSSAAMIDAARQLDPGGPATFAHAADLPLPLASGRFDGCLTVGVLQCLTTADGQALRAAVAELARVLQAGGELLMIDESYNANPASVAAALGLLGAAQPPRGGRRIAVLGDMLEMGEGAAAHHAGLAAPLAANKVDLVFACGAQMKSLWDALPNAQRGAYAENSKLLAPHVMAAAKPGDTVLVKGSNGAKMSVIIEALRGAN